MPFALYDFYLDAWTDWERVVRLRDPNTGDLVPMQSAVMEIRNSNGVLALRLDEPSGRCVIGTDGASIILTISAEDTLTYFQWGNYPGSVQAVGIWGIGRAYIYDLFATYASTQAQIRVMRGFFHVDPNISEPGAAPAPSSTGKGR
jgi:hypothetical protein